MNTPYPEVDYTFADGAHVHLWIELMVWRYSTDVEDVSGTYELNWNGEKVINYDGVFDLPDEVITALKDYGYKIDFTV